MEENIAQFCFNCGNKVPQQAKFCPACGENLLLNTEKDTVSSSQAEQSAGAEKPVTAFVANPNFTLLEAGAVFQDYHILKMMNKDAEGIKYLTERDGKEYVLKVFFGSSFQNMNTLYGLQMRLDRMDKLQDAHIAKVVEVNQLHSPAFMVTEYVYGVSLADIKKYNQDRITEDFVRRLLRQLAKAAIFVRTQGLSISNLDLNGVMLNDLNEPVILSSGISYDENTDEREELFTLGIIAAQLLSKAALSKSIYNANRLREHKFPYINGVSLDLNKVLAECLHRNIIQRYATIKDMIKALDALPHLENASLWDTQEKSVIDASNGVKEAAPKMRIEIGFWLLVILVLGLIAMLFTTNIYTVIFGPKGDKLQYTGFVFGTEADEDSLSRISRTQPARSQSPAQTPYGELKSGSRTDPRRISTPQAADSTPKTPLVQMPKPSADFVHIQPGILAFGSMGDNLANSVSISAFYISKYEVTQAEWNRYMKPAAVSTVGDALPVDNVSWFDIAIYCNGRSEAEGLNSAYKIRGVGASRVITVDFNANGYRLPTEAEWEYAAKAGELHNYSGSNKASDVAWYRDNSAGKLRSPGSKTANAWGIYDMSGNVSEWVWDWYDANYLRALPTFINPSGPDTGTQKSIRGGNVMNGEGRALGILTREKGDPNRQYQYVGFRLVRTK